MYIIMYDNFDEGFLRPMRNNVLTRYGTVFFDKERAEKAAEEVSSWGLYQNIRVYELKEVYYVCQE